jgi:predicted HicB family RNase H-like nuclease
MRYESQSHRSSETLAQQKKAKVGRPKLPKGEAMGSVIQVRFTAEDTRGIASAAKASKQSISEWVRSTIHANLQR